MMAHTGSSRRADSAQSHLAARQEARVEDVVNGRALACSCIGVSRVVLRAGQEQSQCVLLLCKGAMALSPESNTSPTWRPLDGLKPPPQTGDD